MVRTEEIKHTTSLVIDAEKVSVDLDDKQAIIVSDITLVDNVVAQFNFKEVMDAVADHFDFSTVHDYVMERLNEDKE